MKQLRDGTIVLAVPYGMMWGPDKVKPIRHSKPASELEDFGMSLLISRDEGRHWAGPIPAFPQMTISETDFVELPSGDLMLFVNSIFARPDSTVTQPGRQRIYRYVLVTGCQWKAMPREFKCQLSRILKQLLP